MKRKLIEGLIMTVSLLGMVSSGFAVPLSFTLSGTIEEGVAWDLNTGGSHLSYSVANTTSGLDFTMTLTRLPAAPLLDFYGFNVEMEIPGYSFVQPDGDFYSLNATMRVIETVTPAGRAYDFSYGGVGDHIFNVIFTSDGSGRINWAAIGYSMTSAQGIGAYSVHDTEFTWVAASDNTVPVPEPGTMILFCIGATGIAGCTLRKRLICPKIKGKRHVNHTSPRAGRLSAPG